VRGFATDKIKQEKKTKSEILREFSGYNAQYTEIERRGEETEIG
jgi:hypothetical protein